MRGGALLFADVLVPWDAPSARPWSVTLALAEVSIETLATGSELDVPLWEVVSGPHPLPGVGSLTLGDRLRITLDAPGGRGARRVRLEPLQPVPPKERSGPDAGPLPGVRVRIVPGPLEFSPADHRFGLPPEANPKDPPGPAGPEADDTCRP